MHSITMRYPNFSKAILVFSLGVLASCGVSRGPLPSEESTPSVPEDSSSPSVSFDAPESKEDYLLAYSRAATTSSNEPNIRAAMTGGAFSMGFETKEKSAETWNDMRLEVQDFGYGLRLKNIGTTGRKRFGMSFETTRSKISVSGQSLPSFVGDTTNVTLSAKTYITEGTLYLDLTGQELLNTAIQLLLRNLTGDTSWELLDLGKHELTADEYSSLQAGMLMIQGQDYENSLFFQVNKVLPERLVTSVNEDGSIYKMSVSVEGEQELKDVLMNLWSQMEEQTSGLDFSYDFSYDMSGIDLGGISMPTKEQVSDAIDEMLLMMDFKRFSEEVTYHPKGGIYSSKKSFEISSFDRDKFVEFYEKAEAKVEESVTSEETSAPAETEEITYIVPAGKWEYSSYTELQYKGFEVKTLTAEELAEYKYELTLPEWKRGTSGDESSQDSTASA